MSWASLIPALAGGDRYPGATVALDFIAGFYKAPGAFGADFASLPGLAVSRASVGYAERADGSLVQFASNVARITDKGLLVEEARTNSALWSGDVTNAAWAKGTSATGSVSAVVGPDGAFAKKLTEATNTVTHSVSQNINVSAGATVSLTVVAAPAERRYLQLTMVSASDFPNAVFDLQTGTVTQSGATAGAALVSASARQLANGFWACTLIGSITAATTYQVREIIQNSATPGTTAITGGVSYAGDGVSGLVIATSQFEAGAFPTSYIPTTTAAATRPADNISFSGMSSQTGTLYAEALDLVNKNFSQAAGFSDSAAPGSATNRITLGWAALSTSFRITSFGTDAFVADAAVPTAGAVVKLAMSWASGGSALASKDGSTVVATTNTGVVPAAVTFLELGSGGAPTPYLNGYVRRVTFKPSQDAQTVLNAATQ